MKSNSRWMSASVAFVVVSLVTTMLQPAAFGQSASSAEQASQSSEAVTQQPVAPASAPLLVAARAIAGQALSQTQPTAASAATASTRRATAPQTNSGKSKKWILILAAAGAAGTTAYFVSRGNGQPPALATTIVVGSPTVGQPQ